jgi:hypothetical protein
MENKNWKEMWLKNYRGEGDTAELIEFVKKLNYGNRNNVSYLPWATVERIFKLQDGTIETFASKSIEDQNRTTIVEVDRVLTKEEVDEHGVVSRVYSNSYFVNIRVMWQGQVHIERYPIQDSTGRPLTSWTQNDINKALQRGKVKAIAIVSGIGFKLFEDGDLQFEEEPAVQPKPELVAPKPKPVSVPTPVVNTPEKTVILPKQPLVENRIDLENTIKKEFLAGGEKKATLIRDFLTQSNAKKIADLTDQQVKDLHLIISKA